MQAIKKGLSAIWHAVKWFYALKREHKGYIILAVYLTVLVTNIMVWHASQPIEYQRVLSVEEVHAQEEMKEEETALIEVVIDWDDKERVKEEVDKQAKAFHTFADKMHVTVNCESQYNAKAYNGSDPHGGAIGVGQFLAPTFNKYAPLAGVENPDIWNPEHQLQTMAYMFSIGEAKQWTCYRMYYGSKKE